MLVLITLLFQYSLQKKGMQKDERASTAECKDPLNESMTEIFGNQVRLKSFSNANLLIYYATKLSQIVISNTLEQYPRTFQKS